MSSTASSTSTLSIIANRHGSFQLDADCGCSNTRLRPARLCISASSMENSMNTTAFAQATGSLTSGRPRGCRFWRCENNVHGGLKIRRPGRSFSTIALALLRSSANRKSHALLVIGHSFDRSIDHPPRISFFSLATSATLGGENTSHTSNADLLLVSLSKSVSHSCGDLLSSCLISPPPLQAVSSVTLSLSVSDLSSNLIRFSWLLRILKVGTLLFVCSNLPSGRFKDIP